MTTIEDLAAKRDLITRYVAVWVSQLKDDTIEPGVRQRIVADIQRLRGIDEDLIRLDQILRQIQSQAEAHRPAGARGVRSPANEALRSRIVERLDAAGTVVTTRDLYVSVGIDKTTLQNVTKPLLREGRVIKLREGWRALSTPQHHANDATSDAGRRAQ